MNSKSIRARMAINEIDLLRTHLAEPRLCTWRTARNIAVIAAEVLIAALAIIGALRVVVWIPGI